MVLGQSCIALRINDKGTLNPIVLFNFLKSEVGQAYLKQIVSGSTVQLIQLRELERLSIPIPSREEQDEIIRIFDETVAIEKNIKTLRDEQNDLIFSIFNF
jgi:type I restriction enzyme M protein